MERGDNYEMLLMWFVETYSDSRGRTGGQNVNVLKCDECGLVFLSDFIEDIDDYYLDSKMYTNEESIASIRKRAHYMGQADMQNGTF